MNEKVGIVGVGVLGSAMVPNLIRSGFDVIWYDIDASKLNDLAAAGMEVAGAARAVADCADTIITCLPTVTALHEAISGENGIAASAGNNQIIIETSTMPIAEKERARDAAQSTGKVMLDCPVSGNRILALRKQLTAFCSGDRTGYEKVRHVISGFAHRILYVGDFGCGMKMKFVGNVLNLIHNSAAAEAMVLGMKSGLDPELIYQAISGSGSSSSMFEVRGALMVAGDYAKEGMNFSIPLKDAPFISAHAATLQCPIPIYQAALQPYYAAIAQGYAKEDAAAVCAVMERAANFVRKKPPASDAAPASHHPSQPNIDRDDASTAAQVFDQRDFRRALGRFATGITVVTTTGDDGKPEGLTANSFSALSLDPPLVLWCLGKGATSLPIFRKCTHFAVNVLAADQRHLSHRFATPSADKFADIEWSQGIGGVPLLAGSLAQFECRNLCHHDGGDHLIFVGEVAGYRHSEGDPLLFNASKYAVAAPHPDDRGVPVVSSDFADLLL